MRSPPRRLSLALLLVPLLVAGCASSAPPPGAVDLHDAETRLALHLALKIWRLIR